MGTELLAILCFVSFFGLLLVGIPVALSLAVSGLVFGYIGFGYNLFNLVPGRIHGVVTNYTLLAIPLFVFMGMMIERSRIAEDLLDVIGHLARGVNGGMAVAIIVIGVLLGASTGIVGATVVTLGMLTLPMLLRRNYNARLACGTICASGTLGQIVPPSLVLILLSEVMGQPVGTLFAAAFVPGLFLAVLYCIYLVVLGAARPDLAPAIPEHERRMVSGAELSKRFLRVVLPLLVLIFSVLGSIIAGIAAPTEAAAVGALFSVVIVVLAKRFSFAILKETVEKVTKITAMVMFILICAQIFSLAFRGLGGDRLVEDLMGWVPGGLTEQILFMMLVIFILGFFLEWIEITYIALPLFLPLFAAENVDMVWLAVLVCINLQASYLTPPFGWALLFLKGVTPKNVPVTDIYIGVLPFIGVQILALASVFLFPGIATWLPNAIGW